MKIYTIQTNSELNEVLSSFSEEFFNGTLNPAQDSVVDYDFFIADMEAISGNYIHSLAQVEQYIAKRISKGGVLLCFSGSIKVANSRRNYSWIPGLHFNQLASLGNSFNFIDNDNFSKILIGQEEKFTFNCIFTQSGNGSFKEIARNKAGDCVALYGKYGNGHIFILPKPKKQNEFVEYFIKNILPLLETDFEIDSGSKEPMPEEIKNMQVEGQNDIENKITEQKDRVKIEKEKLNELQEKFYQLEEWKDLLWQTGTPLEIIVKKFFSLLGLELEKDADNTDLIGKYEEKEVFVEVKGKIKGIDHKADFRQILDRKVNAENPQEAIAVLVGNPFRLNSLEKRPPSESEDLFARTSIPFAKSIPVGLVHTLELYKIVNDILSGKIRESDRSEILSDIMKSAGLYSYKNKK